jgi:hypothetical protein
VSADRCAHGFTAGDCTAPVDCWASTEAVEAWCRQALASTDAVDQITDDLVSTASDLAAGVLAVPDETTLDQFIRARMIDSYSRFFAQAMKAKLGEFLPGTEEEIAAALAAELRTVLPEPSTQPPKETPDV